MKLTEAEKRELEALRAKTDLTETEKTRLGELEAKAKAENDGDDDKTFSKAYVESLRAENAKYRTRAKDADEKLAKYDGVDPEKYRELETTAKAAEQAKLEGKGEWEKLKENMVQSHQVDLKKKDDEITALKGEKQKLELEIGKTIRKHTVAVEASIAEAINPNVVEMIVEARTQIETSDTGARNVIVLDADGSPAIDLKTGKPLTVAGLLKEMKTSQEYAHLFKGGSSGAGSGTENFGGTSIKNPWKADSSNLTLQGQVIRENPDMARRLIQEAGKDPKVYGL